MTIKGNAIVGQSGGPTCVINQSLVGVIEEVRKHDCIEKLYGSFHGVTGVLDLNFADLDELSTETLETIALTPASALGSSRVKPDKAYCEKMFKVFEENNIRYFFYIGGNDSASTTNIINNLAIEAGYDIKVFHIAKTIDNDLLDTDHCPGYGTAARFVSHAVMGDNQDNQSLPGVKIDVIMGRHAGWLTASSILAKQRDDDGPHLIYLPERPVSMEKFSADIKAVVDRIGRCVVAVSEGICDTDGTVWIEKVMKDVEADMHGNIQLSGSGALADFLSQNVREKTGISRVRADTFGYLQRSFPNIQSDSDASEARQCGRFAVSSAATTDVSHGSIGMKRVEGADYKVDYIINDLSVVASGTQDFPKNFINDEGNGVTQAFIDYLKPLVGELPVMGYIPR